jgi:HD-GYP domain-containing protein (c-di-GMP phosphodiesterase class II)
MNGKVDHLTGLKNITSFREELENSFASSRTSVCTVVVFDIIGLQKVNRSAGRNEGDKRIRSLVQAVYRHMPKDSSVYRGYDAEIIVVCRNLSEQDLINQINSTVRACENQVFFGVASTVRAAGNDGQPGREGSILQALEEAQYDLNVKKMLNEESARSQALTSLVCALEEVDQDTEEHVERTRNMGIALGKRLGLSDVQLTTLELMCLLHDIGKIAIPLEILNKPGKLTDAEWSVLRSHADKGFQIALASKELKPMADYIRYHHERWDGTGYPDGLAEENIPLSSRIMAIADVFDALVSERCYKKAMTPEEAFRIIKEESGTHFDPKLTMVFLRHKREFLLENEA